MPTPPEQREHVQRARAWRDAKYPHLTAYERQTGKHMKEAILATRGQAPAESEPDRPRGSTRQEQREHVQRARAWRDAKYPHLTAYERQTGKHMREALLATRGTRHATPSAPSPAPRAAQSFGTGEDEDLLATGIAGSELSAARELAADLARDRGTSLAAATAEVSSVLRARRAADRRHRRGLGR